MIRKNLSIINREKLHDFTVAMYEGLSDENVIVNISDSIVAVSITHKVRWKDSTSKDGVVETLMVSLHANGGVSVRHDMPSSPIKQYPQLLTGVKNQLVELLHNTYELIE